MNRLLSEPLFYIFLVYGLSFLVMATLIGTELVKTTAITLVSSFWMLVLFGFTHGVAELTDWARFVGKTLAMSESPPLLYFGQVMMILSFVFLLQFAINLMTYKSEKKGIVRAIPFLLFVIYIVSILVLGISDISQMGLIARYSFGIAGSALSAFVLFRLGNTMKAVDIPKLVKGLNVAALGFMCYAVFGGMLIHPILGLPIQLFRAACALTIAIASYSILDVFKTE
jgi:hypothetical protein